ncbi:hypothetical protein [Fulvivirga lutea]|uniref:Uncharacterized protein n=1 Tax=Fulvivirga lutea TaxID=2810512 RepID=A0A974WJZ5_9BACT|nr:hypothetical protein [Fulvivirga lutea]QSE98602.1 hypothetical protein JR347_05855 [Fulvivirga lutea]
MSKKKKKNKDEEKKKDKPTVNKDLEGFNVEIDSFGELKTSYNIDKINEFLNKNVEDKKLVDREDYEELKSGKSDEEE